MFFLGIMNSCLNTFTKHISIEVGEDREHSNHCFASQNAYSEFWKSLMAELEAA
jgi:hypothetical protein